MQPALQIEVTENRGRQTGRPRFLNRDVGASFAGDHKRAVFDCPVFDCSVFDSPGQRARAPSGIFAECTELGVYYTCTLL